MTSFTGGENLEKVLRELAQKVSEPGTLEVGFMEGATYPDGTPVPLVAAIQEFGAPEKNIPPRPYFRGMIAQNSNNWGGQLGKLLKASDYDAPNALDLMGESIKGELTQSIRDFSTPANSEETVARKGFNNPLIDTGHMMNSVASRVKA